MLLSSPNVTAKHTGHIADGAGMKPSSSSSSSYTTTPVCVYMLLSNLYVTATNTGIAADGAEMKPSSSSAASSSSLSSHLRVYICYL